MAYWGVALKVRHSLVLHPVSGDVDPFELCDVEVQPRNNVTQGPNSQPTCVL